MVTRLPSQMMTTTSFLPSDRANRLIVKSFGSSVPDSSRATAVGGISIFLDTSNCVHFARWRAVRRKVARSFAVDVGVRSIRAIGVDMGPRFRSFVLAIVSFLRFFFCNCIVQDDEPHEERRAQHLARAARRSAVRRAHNVHQKPLLIGFELERPTPVYSNAHVPRKLDRALKLESANPTKMH